MPEPDARTLARREEIVAAMRAIVPGKRAIADPDDVKPYESDGSSPIARANAGRAPEPTAQVSAILVWAPADLWAMTEFPAMVRGVCTKVTRPRAVSKAGVGTLPWCQRHNWPATCAMIFDVDFEYF